MAGAMVQTSLCAVLCCAEVPMHLQVMAGEFVAGAMMATLPAIDANDPPKTLASFRLYCMVLSSVGTLQVSWCCLLCPALLLS